MLDLSFGFNALDVQKTFDALGEKGRINYIYSTIILDTFFPILYVLLFISIFLKLNERKIFFLFLSILAGIFDLSENIFISIMMSSYTFGEISTSQIFFASMFNQCKWVLCFFNVIFILYKIISKKINA